MPWCNTLIDEPSLKGGIIPNKAMQLETGIHCADIITTWVKKRIVAGPFSEPPLQGFHSNPIFVVERNNKFRPILDLSSPDGTSFNPTNKRKAPPIKRAPPRAIAVSLLKRDDNACVPRLDHNSVS